MSVVAWLDREGVGLQVTPTFSPERALRGMPQLKNETLLALLKTGCRVREFNDMLYQCYPDAEGYPIFRLDLLLCLQEIELLFGAVASPLGSVRLSGSLRHNPLQRKPLTADTEQRYVLSRFAYQHRVEGELVLDCPLSDVRCIPTSELLMQVLFRVGREPQPAEVLLELAQDDEARQGLAELLGVLAQQGMLVAAQQEVYRRGDEPQAQQAQWDFHNLLFHVESAQGYNTTIDEGHKFGTCFPYHDKFPELPLEHPPLAGDKLTLPTASEEQRQGMSFVDVLQQRKSIRQYDLERPITIAELGAYLDLVMRGKASSRTATWPGNIKVTCSTPRAYPSGGALYEQEVYLAVWRGEGLARGFYHYSPYTHALTRLAPPQASWQLHIERRMSYYSTTEQPDILFMFAARYHRITWKYSRMSYAIVLKNIGCLYQTMYLVATFMGLAPCGQGGGNHRAFAELSGQDPWQEGIAGEFTLGRPAQQDG